MKIIKSESTKYISKRLHSDFNPKYKFCLAQIEIENTFSKSIEKIKKIVKIASNNNCQVVVFPEDSLFGFIQSQEIEKIIKEDELKKIFIEFSYKYSIEILTPTIPMKRNNKIYNSSHFISPNKGYENSYFKNNLWLSEKDVYYKGEIESCGLKIVKSKIGKIAQTICWDLQDAILYKKYKSIGADIVINQAFWYRHRTKKLIEKFGKTKYIWPHTDYRMVDSLNLSRSNENGIITVFVNSAGEYKNLSENETYKPIGISQVVFPGIGIVAKAPRNKECLLIVDLPEYNDILEDFRLIYGL